MFRACCLPSLRARPIPAMDNLHYRLIFDLDNENKISEKNFLKVVKFQNLVEKML